MALHLVWLAKLVTSGEASSMTQHRRCRRFASARPLAEAHRSGILDRHYSSGPSERSLA
jgi:hypothetical protein